MKQLQADLKHTYAKLSEAERRKLSGSTILITGSAGFLGYYITKFLYQYKDELSLKKVICLDNFMLGTPVWQKQIADSDTFVFKKFDIIKDNVAEIPEAAEADYVIHMASIASPTFYRQHPIETVDANVWGLRRLLDFYKQRKSLKGLLFFSSSELYGDPDPAFVPTSEEYHGNVNPVGPRACYDEAKRFGETLCMLYAQQYGMPIGVVRPFNNYGPGMKLDDKRVPADFANNVMQGEDIVILSSGAPSRTFCYIADAVAGYLKTLLYGRYDFFNIGIDKPEISILKLAEIYKAAGEEILGYQGEIRYNVPDDKEYLTNNPQRRCPRIDKAREKLGYAPDIYVEEGVRRFLRFLKEEAER